MTSQAEAILEIFLRGSLKVCSSFDHYFILVRGEATFCSSITHQPLQLCNSLPSTAKALNHKPKSPDLVHFPFETSILPWISLDVPLLINFLKLKASPNQHTQKFVEMLSKPWLGSSQAKDTLHTFGMVKHLISLTSKCTDRVSNSPLFYFPIINIFLCS